MAPYTDGGPFTGLGVLGAPISITSDGAGTALFVSNAVSRRHAREFHLQNRCVTGAIPVACTNYRRT